MIASLSSSIGFIFIVGIIVFFGFLYFSGRAIGAGMKYGGNRWRSGTNEADQKQSRVPPPPPGTRAANPPPPSRNAGWYRDPFGTGQRYWDGSAWTEHTAVNG